jgi:hypothetical protein
MVCVGAAGAFSVDVRTHPVDPEEGKDAPYEVHAGGMHVRLECLASDDPAYYARFTSDASVEVVVSVKNGETIEAKVEPERYVSGLRMEGQGLRFVADGPGPRVVWPQQDGRPLPPLFILFEPPESNPPRPGMPDVYDLRDYGVEPGSAPQTEKIQKALDDCALSPRGGIVYCPPGRYQTGTVVVGSRTFLYLAGGAVIEAVDDPEAFPAEGRWDRDSGHRLLLFDRAENSGLIGRGTLDARGHVLRPHRRVQVVDVEDCRNVTIEGVVLRNSASWNLHILHSDNVRVSDVKIIGGRDGVDPDSSRNVLVERLFSWSDDDSIAVKTTGVGGLLRDCCNIIVRDSVVLTRKTALKVGTETRADIHNVLFENIDVLGSSRGIAVWMRDGHEISQVVYRDIRMDLHEIDGESRSGQPFYVTIRDRAGVGNIRNVLIRNVSCRAPWYSRIESLPGAPIEGLVFENISWEVAPRTSKLDRRPLFYFDHSGEVVFRGLHVDWTEAHPEHWSGLWEEDAPAVASDVQQTGRH